MRQWLTDVFHPRPQVANQAELDEDVIRLRKQRYELVAKHEKALKRADEALHDYVKQAEAAIEKSQH